MLFLSRSLGGLVRPRSPPLGSGKVGVRPNPGRYPGPWVVERPASGQTPDGTPVLGSRGSWSSGRPRTWDGVGSPPSLFGACGVASDTEDRPRGLRHNADNHGDHPGDRIGLRKHPTADNGRGTISRNRTPGPRWTQGVPQGTATKTYPASSDNARHVYTNNGPEITRPRGQGPSHRIGCRGSGTKRD